METQLTFSVKNQTISRTDRFNVVAKSVNYLYAHFDFLTDEWTGKAPTAIFKQTDGDPYEAVLDMDMNCLVPWEVLNAEDATYVYVSVFAGDLITVNTAPVRVAKAGYYDNLESSTEPTPSVYAQIMDRMAEVDANVAEEADRAETAADRAEQAAANAGYMTIGMDENGHLIYERTDSVDVDFALNTDGHLVMEVE